MDLENNIVDDEGTGQDEAREILQSFCDNGFGGDDGRAGLALGRPASEIREMLSGETAIDDDLVMKARGIAKERGLDLI
jgi:hypothetical protein